MSGHSKWAKLKHFKGALDAKKSALFTKFGRMITIAAREGGDPSANFKLRLAIDNARKVNLPKENIDRAIKKGTGELDGAQVEEVVYEAFGPQKIAIIIQALTDNKNRTIASLRRIFNKHGGILAGQNAVSWMFDKKGVIKLADIEAGTQQETELKLIDLGAEDIKIEDNEMVVYLSPESLEKVKEKIEQSGIKIEYAEVEWVAKDPIEVSDQVKEKMESFFDELDEDEDVNNYYTSVK